MLGVVEGFPLLPVKDLLILIGLAVAGRLTWWVKRRDWEIGCENL